MDALLLFVCLLVVLYLVGRAVARTFASAVGRTALERQPDQIHLEAVRSHCWVDEAAAESTTEALAENGFEDAGTYRVPEMEGVVVRLLANPTESLYAAIYEHQQAGFWLDVVAGYQDHTSITFTTSRPTGLRPRPGHPVVHAPGISTFLLCERVLKEMPEGTLRPATVSRAVHDFEEAYAEYMAWRKAHGVTPQEVAEVAKRKAA
jgi:hypothetical protein